MKKTILSFSILLGLLMISCEKNDMSTQEVVQNVDTHLFKQSTMFDSIESFHIDNKVECDNNILILPSWNYYAETIDKLDELIDEECDAFDATVPSNITDDQYDVLADAAGFDEDNPLNRFEDELAFCSLRRKIAAEEDIWLEQQGDGQWDINADPDSHFIDDETERTLLSVNAEVIIGDRKSGYIYYKFLDDAGGMVQVSNWDLEAMAQVSDGTIPTDNPNVVVIPPRKLQSSIDCKIDLKEEKFEINGSNRIKRKCKVRNSDAWSHRKISALTVGYKKKNGKWKRRRTWITAGITDLSGTNAGIVHNQCTEIIEVSKIKEKRRRRVKAKIRGDRHNGNALTIGIKDNEIYSFHKQAVLNVKRDYYDMPIFN